MKKQIIALLLLLASPIAIAAPDGEALYEKHCTVCHGHDGKGGVGVPLSLPSFINSVTDDYLRLTIRLGRPGRIMPSFPKLSDAQLNAIVRHMRIWTNEPAVSYNTRPIKGNAKRGGELYADYCADCHGEDGKGEGLGDGVELVYQKLYTTLKQKGLEPMESNGEVFDPELHDAITEIPAPSEDLKGKIVDTIEKGYRLNDKIIRHAKVVVGK